MRRNSLDDKRRAHGAEGVVGEGLDPEAVTEGRLEVGGYQPVPIAVVRGAAVESVEKLAAFV